MTGSPVTARANVNVALVKYWGKRDPTLNLPATGSISLTLDGLSVEAEVGFGDGGPDEVTIDGEPAQGDERDAGRCDSSTWSAPRRGGTRRRAS